VNADDRRCIAACLAGESEQFNVLVRRYQDRLFNSVLRVVQNPEDAADAVQETFINAYQSLGSFKGDAEFFTWLYRIAFNAAITNRRKNRTMLPLEKPGGDLSYHPADGSMDSQPDDRLTRDERNRELYAAMATLSEDHRTVLILRDIDEMNYEQLAEILNVPIGTVRSRLNRARLELRKRLEKSDESGSETP
jgi:RNA polymerase sigma-70 factor, ECF subfamily